MHKAIPSALGAVLTSLFLSIGAAGSAHAQATTYSIDASHTFVTWEAMHFGTSTSRGRFDKKEGTIQIDRAAKTGRIDVTIDTGSVSTGLAFFDKELRGKKFFDTDNHPTARFVADRINFEGNNVQSATGLLTMLGKTLPVTVTAVRFNCYDNPFVKREVCGGDFEAIVQRSLWGMTSTIPAASDNVKLLIQVEAVKQ
ncbi:MAG: YceI family protein [Rhizobacter sp.]